MKARHLIPVWSVGGEVVGYVLRDGRSAPRPQTRGPRPEEEGPPRQAAPAPRTSPAPSRHKPRLFSRGSCFHLTPTTSATTLLVMEVMAMESKKERDEQRVKDNVETLRMHARMLCKEAGLKPLEIVAQVLDSRRYLRGGGSRPVKIYSLLRGNAPIYSSEDFGDIETYVCGLRSGARMATEKEGQR